MYELLFFLLFILLIYLCISSKKRKICFNIAHGCGKIGSVLYTNALEAFYKSYSNGFKNIEIDIQVINNSHIIGAHDMQRFKYFTNYSSNEVIDNNYICLLCAVCCF